ncbi:MAG: hypothetical protein JAY63_20730, partial [Candidatus Thiodiazotropha taylori]|nr:hypothetical protein [Candidatus Thiodiazotropha taylori]
LIPGDKTQLTQQHNPVRLPIILAQSYVSNTIKGVKALFLYFLKADQKFHFITLSRSPKKALTPLFEVVEKL